MTYISHSASETEELGARLARTLGHKGKTSTFIALFGELGAGKTAFVRGFCRELGVFRVKSPTYTVINEYTGAKCPLFHLDMYRLSGTDDLESVGYRDYETRGGYMLCEWAQRLGDELPSDAVRVSINRIGNTENGIDSMREIEITEELL